MKKKHYMQKRKVKKKEKGTFWTLGPVQSSPVQSPGFTTTLCKVLHTHTHTIRKVSNTVGGKFGPIFVVSL